MLCTLLCVGGMQALSTMHRTTTCTTETQQVRGDWKSKLLSDLPEKDRNGGKDTLVSPMSFTQVAVCTAKLVKPDEFI